MKYSLQLDDALFSVICASKSRKKRSTTTPFTSSINENIPNLKKREVEESAQEIEMRSYGSRLRYQCGLARRFLDPETGRHYDDRWMTCNWNSSWTLTDTLDTCEWVACINPPTPPEEALIALQWDGNPIEFDGNVSYTCKDEDLYFEMDKDMEEYNVTCLEDGSWDVPAEWPVCFNCKIGEFKFISRLSLFSGQLHRSSCESRCRYMGMEWKLQLWHQRSLHLWSLRQLFGQQWLSLRESDIYM